MCSSDLSLARRLRAGFGGCDGDVESVPEGGVKKALTRRDGIVLAIVEEIESRYDWDEDSEPVETVIETFVGELMDEVEKELIFWEQ